MSDPAAPPARLLRSEPVFAVADVKATLAYYRDILGFEAEWTWGEPPTFGGCCRGRVSVMFCEQPEIARAVTGHMHMFFLEGVDALHAEHVARGAQVVKPLQDEPWGVREYALLDLNGYHLRFGEFRVEPAHHSAGEVEGLVLVKRRPTSDEYRDLLVSVGWDQFVTDERVLRSPEAAWHSVVAEVNGRAIGAGLAMGDGATYYYLKDIMVRPEYQGRGVGSAMVTALLKAIRRHGPPRALVGLYTVKGLESFYERFGFAGPDDGLYGMTLRL